MTWKNRQQLESSCAAAANYIYTGDNTGICRVLGVHKMYVDTRDQSLFPHLAMDGYWESWVTLALGRLLKPGMRCIDVGANFGYYTLLMGGAVGPDGEVVAVEANQDIAFLLEKTVNVNGMDGHVRVQADAAWSESGKKMIVDIPRFLMGSASVREGAAEHCKSIALDDLVTGQVDIVKIDAEGSEPKVLEGMQRIIADNPNLFILMEWSPGSPGFDDDFYNELWGQFEVMQVMGDGSFVAKDDPPDQLQMLLLVRHQNQDSRTRTRHQNLTMEE